MPYNIYSFAEQIPHRIAKKSQAQAHYAFVNFETNRAENTWLAGAILHWYFITIYDNKLGMDSVSGLIAAWIFDRKGALKETKNQKDESRAQQVFLAAK